MLSRTGSGQTWYLADHILPIINSETFSPIKNLFEKKAVFSYGKIVLTHEYKMGIIDRQDITKQHFYGLSVRKML